MSEIHDKYIQTNIDRTNRGERLIGVPQTNTPEPLLCADGIGQFQHFESGESIFYHPDTGAHVVGGLIRAKWANLGDKWERSPVGYPTSDELDSVTGNGKVSNFQHGSIFYKSGANEAFAVWGVIFGRYAAQGAEAGNLGFPLTDEYGVGVDNERRNEFEGGIIWYTGKYGANIVLVGQASVTNDTDFPIIVRTYYITLNPGGNWLNYDAGKSYGSDGGTKVYEVASNSSEIIPLYPDHKAARLTINRNLNTYFNSLDNPPFFDVVNTAHITFNTDERIHITNQTTRWVVAKMYNIIDGAKTFTLPDGLHNIPASSSDFAWFIPDDVESIKITFDDTDEQTATRGSTVFFNKENRVFIDNFNLAEVKFLFFGVGDSLLTFTLPDGEKIVDQGRTPQKTFTIPPDLTVVQVRANVIPQLFGDNRGSATKFEVKGGDRLVCQPDGTVVLITA